MVDLTPLDNYRESPDNFMEAYVKHELTRWDLNEFLNFTLRGLDSSIVWSNGMRPSQTISYIYVREVTQFIYTVENYVEDEKEKDEWFTKLLELHNKNLEYEKLNPPVPYDDKKFDKPIKCKKPKHKSVIEKEKKQQEKKESAAQRKLKEHALKLGKLTFKLAQNE